MSMSAASILTLGSAGIKLIGKLFGGKTEQIANKVAIIADEAKTMADPENHMKAKLAELPPEDLVEVKRLEVRIAEIDAGTEKARLQAGTAKHAESQESYRAEVNSSDEYVKHTRPGLARKSFYCGTAYIFLTELLKGVLAAESITFAGADPSIIAFLYSPLGAYIGSRTVEAFSATGKTAGGVGIKDIVKMGLGAIRR